MAKRNKISDADAVLRDSAPGVRRFIDRWLRIREDAEDIWQEVCYRFLTHTGEIENATAWLIRVARNLLINSSGRQREFTFADDDISRSDELLDIAFCDDSAPADVLMLRAMVWDELEIALAELPPEQSEAFRLTEIEGKSVKEVALMTGVNAATITSRKYYAVRYLRDRLADIYEDLIVD